MSSVNDEKECPRCKGDLHTNEDDNVTENFGFCLDCGYGYHVVETLNVLDKVNVERENWDLPLINELEEPTWGIENELDFQRDKTKPIDNVSPKKDIPDKKLTEKELVLQLTEHLEELAPDELVALYDRIIATTAETYIDINDVEWEIKKKRVIKGLKTSADRVREARKDTVLAEINRHINSDAFEVQQAPLELLENLLSALERIAN